jgi:hypothetical protein
MRGYGCIEHPAFPAPSVNFGRDIRANLGRITPRERAVVFFPPPSARKARGGEKEAPRHCEERRARNDDHTTRHHPRKRVIQYAEASRLNHRRLWNTGSPGPGYAKASPGFPVVGRRSFSEGGKPGDDTERNWLFEN